MFPSSVWGNDAINVFERSQVGLVSYLWSDFQNCLICIWKKSSVTIKTVTLFAT